MKAKHTFHSVAALFLVDSFPESTTDATNFAMRDRHKADRRKTQYRKDE